MKEVYLVRDSIGIPLKYFKTYEQAVTYIIAYRGSDFSHSKIEKLDQTKLIGLKRRD